MMHSKILAEVLVPASGEKYDVFIPLTVRMGEATRLVAAAISELTEGRYKTTDDTILCNADTGHIYDVNAIVAELHLKNGVRLMLI
ncbi:MAG: methyltransferase [Clostridia bacterium]|nr:methyltransferase [Clostridia bacterium]